MLLLLAPGCVEEILRTCVESEPQFVGSDQETALGTITELAARLDRTTTLADLHGATHTVTISATLAGDATLVARSFQDEVTHEGGPNAVIHYASDLPCTTEVDAPIILTLTDDAGLVAITVPAALLAAGDEAGWTESVEVSLDLTATTLPTGFEPDPVSAELDLALSNQSNLDIVVWVVHDDGTREAVLTTWSSL